MLISASFHRATYANHKALNLLRTALFSGLYSVSSFNHKDRGLLLGGAAADANKPHNKGKQSVTLLNLWPFVWYPDHKSLSGLYSTLIHLWWPAMFGHYGALKVIWRSYLSHWCKITLKLPGRRSWINSSKVCLSETRNYLPTL